MSFSFQQMLLLLFWFVFLPQPTRNHPSLTYRPLPPPWLPHRQIQHIAGRSANAGQVLNESKNGKIIKSKLDLDELCSLKSMLWSRSPIQFAFLGFYTTLIIASQLWGFLRAIPTVGTLFSVVSFLKCLFSVTLNWQDSISVSFCFLCFTWDAFLSLMRLILWWICLWSFLFVLLWVWLVLLGLEWCSFRKNEDGAGSGAGGFGCFSASIRPHFSYGSCVPVVTSWRWVMSFFQWFGSSISTHFLILILLLFGWRNTSCIVYVN